MRVIVLLVFILVAGLAVASDALGQYTKIDGELPAELGPGAKDSILTLFIWRPTPVVPEKAKREMKQATVWLRITVGEKGKVQSAVSVACDAPGYGFEKEAQDAIKPCLFLPQWDGPYAVTYVGYCPVVFDPATYDQPSRPFWNTTIDGCGLDGPEIEPSTPMNSDCPEKAARKLAEGGVTIKMRINEKGRAVTAKSYGCSHEGVGLESAAVKAVRGTEFPIKLENGKPKSYMAYTRVEFRLSDQQLQAAGLPLKDDSLDPAIELPPPFSVSPEYPIDALRMKIEGVVVVAVLIAPDSSVITVRLDTTSGSRILDENAMVVVRTLKFPAALKDGKHIYAWSRIPVVYALKPSTPNY